jgi:hypothetical protein
MLMASSPPKRRPIHLNLAQSRSKRTNSNELTLLTGQSGQGDVVKLADR